MIHFLLLLQGQNPPYTIRKTTMSFIYSMNSSLAPFYMQNASLCAVHAFECLCKQEKSYSFTTKIMNKDRLPD